MEDPKLTLMYRGQGAATTNPFGRAGSASSPSLTGAPLKRASQAGYSSTVRKAAPPPRASSASYAASVSSAPESDSVASARASWRSAFQAEQSTNSIVQKRTYAVHEPVYQQEKSYDSGSSDYDSSDMHGDMHMDPRYDPQEGVGSYANDDEMDDEELERVARENLELRRRLESLRQNKGGNRW